MSKKISNKFLPHLDRRIRSFAIALGLSVALISPTFLSTFASAAEVTQRSIQLSSSSAGAANSSYTVNFTATGAAGAFVIEFCANSPFIPSTCTAPTGFTAASATGSAGFTDVTDSANKVVVAGTINAADNVSVALGGITNPTTSGPFYARIVTYDTKSHAISNYTSTDLGNAGTNGWVDTGSAAINITDTIGVSAAVLETMTFCIGKTIIGSNCDLTGVAKPTIALGETVGSVVALSPNAVSTGSIFTQISTNSAGGAIINLKSSATGCGGLKRAGDPTACNITPALNTGIAAGDAKFGVKTNTATDGTNGAGTLEPISGSYYNNTTYGLHYVAGDTTGVTSPYGDPFLDTNSAPVNNKNMELTFAASASNNTPAGNYSADVSLIATGTF